MPNPVVLLTGASKGIGAATARLLASEGYRLLLTGRDEVALNALQQELAATHPATETLLAVGEVRDNTFCEQLVQTAVAKWGQLDVLINNAGLGGKVGLLSEVPVEQIEAMLDTNLKAPILLCRAALQVMVPKGQGTIINLNSVAGKTAFPYWAVYDATKFGLRALTEALCEEQRSNGIRVLGIYPGAVATAIWDGLDLQQVPDKTGMLTPEQVAEAVRYALKQPQHVLVSEITLQPLKPAL
jgi:NADP-dependent 3-hydroxy acid dehydrogenase YdfG